MLRSKKDVQSIRHEPGFVPSKLGLAALSWVDVLRTLSTIVIGTWGLNVGLSVILFRGLTWPGSSASKLAFFFLLQTTIPVIVCWTTMKRKGEPAFWKLQITKIASTHVLVSLILGVVLASFMAAIIRWDSASSSLQTTLINTILKDMHSRIAFAVVLVLSCTLEEMFLRGYLFPFVRARSGFIAGLLALVLWLASDFLPRFPGPWYWIGTTLWFALLVKHVVLTIQRELSSSLLPPMLTHLVCNLLIASLVLGVFGTGH